jgi:hypothetical protein
VTEVDGRRIARVRVSIPPASPASPEEAASDVTAAEPADTTDPLASARG